MAYANVTFAQAKAQLALMLGDPTNVFWTDAELGVYITEALRTWGAASMYWKERGTFATVASTPFYALQTQLPTQLGYTVTDQNIVAAIQYQLLEPSTGNSWPGTDQFTLATVTNAIQRRRNQFLVETGAVLTHGTQIIAPLALGRFALDDTVIDVRRAAFQAVLSTDWTTLWRADEWAIGANFAMTWVQNPGTPAVYSVSVTPPVTIQIAPAPTAAGTLDLLTVEVGAALDPTAGVVLGIPDDFSWVVKWGALADLLGADGQARDPQRAEYCQKRWEDGIALARIYTSIMQLQVNDVAVYTCSLQELDAGNPTWQQTEGSPTVGALAGLNMLALSDVPDGVYGISADVVRKAPVPAADGDFLQVGQEELDAILRYAEHVAAFKMAGDEFLGTIPQYEGLMKAAMVSNERLRANARNFNVLTDRAKVEESRRPRRLQEVGA